jgi:MFS family permease
VTITTAPSRGSIRAATAATYTAFVIAGLAFASWASRIPQLGDQLQLDPSTLGMVLLSVSAGCVTALPLSGPVVARFGSRRTVAASGVLFGAGLATVAVGSVAGVAPVVVGLVVLGFATGAWDVAMNLQGTALERHLRRSIMSCFPRGLQRGERGRCADRCRAADHRLRRYARDRSAGPGRGNRPAGRGRSLQCGRRTT